MKRKIVLYTAMLFAFALITSCSKVVIYPGIEGLQTSDLFEVKVNQSKVWTEKFVSSMDTSQLPSWFSAPYVREPQELHIAGFAGKGKMKITIYSLEKIEKVSIRPASRGIRTVVEGNKLSFTIPGPDKLVVEINDLPPLFVFADPLEEDIPSPDDENVRYFGPGVHRPGLIEVKDNETVYIAPGAIVYGGIRATGVSGITVKGRGILDGNWEFRSMVRLEECQNVRFEGITTRYGKGWTNTIVNSTDVQYDNVKVLSFGPGGDGINPLGSRRVVITNCFLRCTDDCIAIKAPSRDHPVSDILITRNTMIGFAYSDGVTVGFETNAEYMRDIVVRDCDILLARGGSRVDGHSGFSIICDGPAVISNVLFENIRVEESEVKLFELHITDGTKYGTGPSGHIRDITVRDVEWFHEGPIAILGFDENRLVENVLFENCRVGDKPLSLDREGLFVINEFTRNIDVR